MRFNMEYRLYYIAIVFPKFYHCTVVMKENVFAPRKNHTYLWLGSYISSLESAVFTYIHGSNIYAPNNLYL